MVQHNGGTDLRDFHPDNEHELLLVRLENGEALFVRIIMGTEPMPIDYQLSPRKHFALATKLRVGVHQALCVVPEHCHVGAPVHLHVASNLVVERSFATTANVVGLGGMASDPENERLLSLSSLVGITQ